jgi:hypothetical protein
MPLLAKEEPMEARLDSKTERRLHSLQAQDFIEDFEIDWPRDESTEDAESADKSASSESSVQRRRGDVPCGPSEKDKRLPSSVAQGD